MIFDTHTHLNDEAFADKVAEKIQSAHQLGVDEMAIVGCDVESNKKSIELSQQYDELYSIIGIHPTEIKGYNQVVENDLQEQLTLKKVVALGEIGLDYYWMEDEPKEQERILRRQMAIAREMKMPVSIHTRSKDLHDTTAYEDMYRILKEEKVPGIIHSFNGNTEWMKRFVDLGMMVSFSGVVTFKNAKEVQQAAKEVPSDFYLVETDAPYLAPVPFRGQQNEPGYTRYVVEKLVELRDEPLEVIAAQTTRNAHRLFGIEGSKL